MNERYPHLIIGNPTQEIAYISTKCPPRPKYPERDRQSHGRYIKSSLDKVWQESEDELIATHSTRNGIYIEYESSPAFDMAIKSLEKINSGVRICNVRILKSPISEDETTYATVYVPNTKKQYFYKKIKEYLNKDTKKGNSKNKNLIESINEIRKALLIDSFWLDDPALIPQEKPDWCEIWLRDDDTDVEHKFEQFLNQRKIRYKPGNIKFPERIVKLVYVSREHLEAITLNFEYVAEYRKAKETSRFFLEESPADQAEWVKNLIDRLNIDENSNISICILDTGVNNGHPLIKNILKDQDCLSVLSEWGNHDHNGHGTLMAGLCGYNDLKALLESDKGIYIQHLLESVKLLPTAGQTNKELWGDYTNQAISQSIINNPYRKKIYCCAVSSTDHRDQGRPSSWSGAIDNISSGVDGNDKKLIIIATGNSTAIDTNFHDIAKYPDFQISDSIHDPGQSWNALTVGAFTQLDHITDSLLNHYKPVAKANQISPFTTTSCIWDDKWPIKPEVVFEGGNIATDNSGFVSECDDLRLISTYYKPNQKLFSEFSMTSAATAQASNFAARLQTQYPDYWPETIKALIIHSASWTKEMFDQFVENETNKSEIKNLLRICGYGVPNYEKAVYCASNALTLIAESEIQPFKKDSSVKMNEMHFYSLPWPKEELENLGEVGVEMRITLSYFIEPGPGEIGWNDRYRYPSFNLQFAVNSPSETKNEFIKRINKAVREDENDKPDTSSAAKHWVIGKARDKGSIHSDIWKGTAAELAASNKIAIFPKTGWWKQRNYLKQYVKKTRYSLIVSIYTPELDIDIYTPVKAKISVPVEIITINDNL